MARWRWGAVVVGVLALGLVVQHTGFAAKAAPANDNEAVYKELDLFENALSIVRSDYVEEPEAQKLIYGALKGMLATLDPYSQFMDPDSYNELKVETEGEFGGLGIEITIKDELLTIISPIDDTPAFKAGLLANDRIVKIDGELTRGITLMEAVKKLRGKPGTDVQLTILREGENELKEVTLARAIIKIDSVREAKILEEKIGYVRLSDFRERSTADLEAGLKRLQGEGMDSLIVDLRNNPGGLLDVAISVSELFLDRHQLIVSTKGRLKNQNQEFRAQENGIVNGIPLVVLINEGSASASEIFAGAMQDHHRAIVLGTKSHGKASVQTIFPLKDGSALRLTTSKYFTPDGRSIHGQGIQPDVVVPFERPAEGADASAAKDQKRDEKKPDEQPAGELKDKDTATPDSEELFNRIESGETLDGASKKHVPLDNQLARAVDLLKGIKVYESRDKERLHASR